MGKIFQNYSGFLQAYKGHDAKVYRKSSHADSRLPYASRVGFVGFWALDVLLSPKAFEWASAGAWDECPRSKAELQALA